MTKDEMLRDFLNWEDSHETKPAKQEDIPASQLETIPAPKERVRADEKPAATFHTPDRPEPLSPPHAEVVIPYEEIEVPAVMSPMSAEHKALEQLSEKRKPLFNGTVQAVKDLTAEEIQEKIHAIDERIEMQKVQKWAMRVTLEGKLSFITAEAKKKIREKDTEFYVARKEKGAAKIAAQKVAKPKSPAQELGKFEKNLKSLIGMHMDEAAIRKVLVQTNTPIPENLTAIITALELKLRGK